MEDLIDDLADEIGGRGVEQERVVELEAGRRRSESSGA